MQSVMQAFEAHIKQQTPELLKAANAVEDCFVDQLRIALVEQAIIEAMDEEVLSIEATSYVGRRCLHFLRSATATMVMMDERDERDELATSIARQCNVWYYG
jgi:hypothetical protein